LDPQIWDILDEPFNEQGNWEITPYAPQQHFVNYVEWLPEGHVRFYATGFVVVTGILDQKPPWVIPQEPLPLESTVEFKMMIRQSWAFITFQVAQYSGSLQINQISSQVTMNNRNKPTQILADTWYTFRLVYSGGGCSLYKKTETSPWELAAYWPSLMVSSGNMLFIYQVAVNYPGTPLDAEVKVDYLKMASGVYIPSDEPEPTNLPGFSNLLAKFSVRHNSSVALFGKFKIRHSSSADLITKFKIVTKPFTAQGISVEHYIALTVVKPTS